MGANQQTSVPAFTAGQVLTAQQQTEINTGIPVFADSTARTAAFGGTGEKVLAEGQYSYLEDTNSTEVYDGSSWVSVGTAAGMVLVSTTTIGSAVSSVTVTGAFSATYDNYLIVVSGGAASTANYWALKLGAITTGYYYKLIAGAYNTTTLDGTTAGANAANFLTAARGTTDSYNGEITLIGPNLSKKTYYRSVTSLDSATGSAIFSAGYLNDTTAVTDFTLTPNTGTLTGGTVRVYGYKN